MFQPETVTLASGLRLVVCLFDSGMVPKRKCRGVDHEVCSRSRAMESTRILFRQNQFHPVRKTKVTRRLPRVKDWGRGGRELGSKRKPRKLNPITIAKRKIKAADEVMAEVLQAGVALPQTEVGRKRNRTAKELGLILPALPPNS